MRRLRWQHQPTASPLHPGEESPSGPSPSSSTQPLLLALPGDSKTVHTFKECLSTVPGTRPTFPKIWVPKSVYFERSYHHSRILPEGLLFPDAQVQPPGAKIGFVLETSNTTRRCEHTLHQLVMWLILTSKPKTKHQVVKKSHKPLKDEKGRLDHRQVSIPCKCSEFLKICAGY